MAEFDHGVKLLAQTSGRQLARVAGVICREWTPLESTVQVTAERLADRVFRARRGRRRFVVYLEFYTVWDRAALWDLLLKSSMLSNRERLPTMTLVFILRPRGYRRQRGQFRLTVGAEPTQALWFKEVPLWETEPEPWWEQAPGLMTLYPLCRHGQRPRQAVQHAAQVIEERVTDRLERADNLCILNIFGGLAYPHLDIRAIIGREKMKESRFYRDVRAEGELLAKRAALTDAVQIRFGDTALAEFAAAIDALEDSAELTRLYRLAIGCNRLDEFRSAWSAR
jgi:hypothetical protein